MDLKKIFKTILFIIVINILVSCSQSTTFGSNTTSSSQGNNVENPIGGGTLFLTDDETDDEDKMIDNDCELSNCDEKSQKIEKLSLDEDQADIETIINKAYEDEDQEKHLSLTGNTDQDKKHIEDGLNEISENIIKENIQIPIKRDDVIEIDLKNGEKETEIDIIENVNKLIQNIDVPEEVEITQKFTRYLDERTSKKTVNEKFNIKYKKHSGDINLLFVIDNSGSMEGEIQQLQKQAYNLLRPIKNFNTDIGFAVTMPESENAGECLKARIKKEKNKYKAYVYGESDPIEGNIKDIIQNVFGKIKPSDAGDEDGIATTELALGKGCDHDFKFDIKKGSKLYIVYLSDEDNFIPLKEGGECNHYQERILDYISGKSCNKWVSNNDYYGSAQCTNRIGFNQKECEDLAEKKIDSFLNYLKSDLELDIKIYGIIWKPEIPRNLDVRKKIYRKIPKDYRKDPKLYKNTVFMTAGAPGTIYEKLINMTGGSSEQITQVVITNGYADFLKRIAEDAKEGVDKNLFVLNYIPIKDDGIIIKTKGETINCNDKKYNICYVKDNKLRLNEDVYKIEENQEVEITYSTKSVLKKDRSVEFGLKYKPKNLKSVNLIGEGWEKIAIAEKNGIIKLRVKALAKVAHSSEITVTYTTTDELAIKNNFEINSDPSAKFYLSEELADDLDNVSPLKRIKIKSTNKFRISRSENRKIAGKTIIVRKVTKFVDNKIKYTRSDTDSKIYVYGEEENKYHIKNITDNSIIMKKIKAGKYIIKEILPKKEIKEISLTNKPLGDITVKYDNRICREAFYVDNKIDLSECTRLNRPNISKIFVSYDSYDVNNYEIKFAEGNFKLNFDLVAYSFKLCDQNTCVDIDKTNSEGENNYKIDLNTKNNRKIIFDKDNLDKMISEMVSFNEDIKNLELSAEIYLINR